MSISRFALAFIVLAGLAGCGGSSDSSQPAPEPPKPAYPQTRAGTDSDVYFGRAVADPYRWLEDIDSTETDDWVRAQNQLTAKHIAEMADYAALSKRIAAWFVPPPSGAAKQSGEPLEQQLLHIEGVQGKDGKYYYQIQKQQRRQDYMRPGQAPEFVSVDNAIYVANNASDTRQGEQVVDANTFRIDPDDHIQLLGHQVSADGKYLVYAMVRNYADLAELHVVDLQQPGQGPVLRIANAYSGTFALLPDGIAYASPRHTANPHVSPHTYQTLYYQPYSGQSPEAWVQADQYDQIGSLLVHAGHLYYGLSTAMRGALGRIDLAHPEAGGELLIDLRPQGALLALQGTSPADPTKLQFTTSQGAALNRLIEIDPEAPGNWLEILPNSPAGVTDFVNAIQNCGADYYAEHLVQGSSTLVHYNNGTRHDIALPGAGSVSELQCRESNGQPLLSYIFSSLSQPHVQYIYDPATHSQTKGWSSSHSLYDPSRYEMRRLTATSKDGTQFPVYIAHKKGLQADGEAPTMLYVYGGFFAAITPSFQEKLIPLLESGGVYAIAQVRGGSEFGMDWYESGRLLNKQNTYDDVAAAATQLIDAGLTRPGKLALQGESNGGLSTAVLGLQRSDLFAVVFPTVGVLDLVRYDLFSSGFGWHGDYGQVSNQAEFENLMKFSPLHNVKAQAYTPTYVFTGKSDGRVMPAHSYKYAATLQNTATGSNPYMLYAFPKDGHGLDSNRQYVMTYMWTAFFHHTNSRYTPPVQ